MTSGRRVGVLGGTFDPVHIGHLAVAVDVRAALDLDVVLLMVAAAPWQKVGTRDNAPAADRVAVARAAVDGLPGVEVSTMEIDRGGTTFTADTVADLRRDDAHVEIFLVIGADVASDLASWKRLDEIRRDASLVTVGRPGSVVPLAALREDGWRVEHVEVPGLDVSSSAIRARRAAGRPIDVLVPPLAVREIEKRGLYARTG